MVDNIEKVKWFPTNIFYTKINTEFCNKLEQKVMVDKLKWEKNLKNVNALTTGWNGLKQYGELREIGVFICNEILPSIGKLENWKYNNWQTQLAWINFYEKGDSAKIHNHHNVDFCAVLIIKPGNGNLIFSNTNLIHGYTRPFEVIHDEKINEEKGTLLLFPSYLYHTVTNCDSERISVAMNFENNTIKN